LRICHGPPTRSDLSLPLDETTNQIVGIKNPDGSEQMFVFASGFAFANLSDVSLTDSADGDTLVYASGQWVNTPAPE